MLEETELIVVGEAGSRLGCSLGDATGRRFIAGLAVISVLTKTAGCGALAQPFAEHLPSAT